MAGPNSRRISNAQEEKKTDNQSFWEVRKEEGRSRQAKAMAIGYSKFVRSRGSLCHRRGSHGVKEQSQKEEEASKVERQRLWKLQQFPKCWSLSLLPNRNLKAEYKHGKGMAHNNVRLAVACCVCLADIVAFVLPA